MNNPAPVPLWRDPAGSLNTKLSEMLHLLMEAGSSNVIAPPSMMPDPSLRDAFEKLATATRAFEIAPGVGLADHFWEHAGDFRRGAVADRLRETAKGRGKFVPGFLAIYATSVRSPLAYGPKRMPFRDDRYGGGYLRPLSRSCCLSATVQHVRNAPQRRTRHRRSDGPAAAGRDALDWTVGSDRTRRLRVIWSRDEWQGAYRAHAVPANLRRRKKE